MIRVGVLLKSLVVKKHLYEVIKELSDNNEIELYFLLNDEAIQQHKVRMLNNVVFEYLCKIEYRVLSFFSNQFKQEYKEHYKLFNVEGLGKKLTRTLKPKFSKSGLIVRYPEDDIRNIKSLDLDIIIRGNASGIFKGEILNSSKHGVISFHHGDNRWNRGGPPGFWEVFLKKTVTGFVIQILSEDLDGGKIIYRGGIVTRETYLENLIGLNNESNSSLVKIVLDIAKEIPLPEPEESVPFGSKLLVLPTIRQSLVYLTKVTLPFVRNKVLKNTEYTELAFLPTSTRDAVLRKGIRIKAPLNHTYSKPIVHKFKGQTVCFFLDYESSKKKKCISGIELINEKEYRPIGTILSEPYDLSSPYIFEYNDELYMISHAHSTKSLRLYHCKEFPSKWEYVSNIMENKVIENPMIFNRDGKWWLFTNEGSNEYQYCTKLMGYDSTDPLSMDWASLESNPILFDGTLSVNRGVAKDIEGNSLIRFSKAYMGGNNTSTVALSKIVDISSNGFKYKEIGAIIPGFFKKVVSLNHVSSNGFYTVYEYNIRKID